jgi:hypothetical protein
VFTTRYHAEIIDTPRRARQCLAYVLDNRRRHREDQVGPAQPQARPASSRASPRRLIAAGRASRRVTRVAARRASTARHRTPRTPRTAGRL